jgi:hypothetical protein
MTTVNAGNLRARKLFIASMERAIKEFPEHCGAILIPVRPFGAYGSFHDPVVLIFNDDFRSPEMLMRELQTKRWVKVDTMIAADLGL